jgi:hypothetical protein
MRAETLEQATAMLEGLAEDVGRLRARVEALERPALVVDPAAPTEGFQGFCRRARAHDERRRRDEA